jgi:hypothetical protein
MSQQRGSELKAERRLKRQQTRAAAEQVGGRRPATESLIAFVHIPKTAGGTLKSVLSEALGREALHDSGNYLRDPETTVAQSFPLRRGQRITIGHVPYGLYRERLPGDTRYITLLREPVDRVISHYYRHLAGKAGTLPDALESGMPQLTNLMTRFLCGHIDILGELPDGALDDAKANLEGFTFVGFQERFDESLLLLLERIGVPQLAYGASRHVSESRPSLDDLAEEERAIIAAHNQLDVELYRWARGRFDAELEARGDDLRAAVEILRSEGLAKTADQNRRTELAVEWLSTALPAGSARPQQELFAEAELAGFTRAELKRAKRQLKPACRNRFTDDGLHWEMRPSGEEGKRPGERRRRARRMARGASTPPSEPDERPLAAKKVRKHRHASTETLSTAEPGKASLESDSKTSRRRAEQRVAAGEQHERLIAFVHIPKTAGGTLKSVFADAFGSKSIHNAGNYLLNTERTTEKATTVGPHTRFTLGHVPYGLFRSNLPPDTRYITFLREPIERVVSHWFRHLDGKKGSLPEALESGMPQVTNLMTRFLCGHVDALGQLPDSAVDEAKTNLESFDFVGFQDRFDESLVVLQERLGMPMTPYGQSVHVNANRPEVDAIDEATVELIKQHNHLDVELYTWARERFGAEFDARRAEVGGAVSALQDAITHKVAEQLERTELALRWLTEQVPPGTERPLEELKAEAEKIGLTTRDLNQGRRRMNPPSRKRKTDRGIMLMVKLPSGAEDRSDVERDAAG